MFLPKALTPAAAALAVAAPASQAATDTVVATTAKPTPLAADGGTVLYSAWDGSRYRLTQLGGDAIDVAGSSEPFVVDLDGDIAVYPRAGRLFSFDLGTREERDLRADGAVAGSLSNGRLVYATKKGIYVRAHGKTTRVTGK